MLSLNPIRDQRKLHPCYYRKVGMTRLATRILGCDQSRFVKKNIENLDEFSNQPWEFPWLEPRYKIMENGGQEAFAS